MNGARWMKYVSYLVRIISWATVNIFCLLPSLSPVDYVRQWSRNQYLVLMTLLIMVADPVFYLVKRSWWIGSKSSRARSCWRSPQPTCFASNFIGEAENLSVYRLGWHFDFYTWQQNGTFFARSRHRRSFTGWLGTTLALNALQWNPGNDRNINCKCFRGEGKGLKW